MNDASGDDLWGHTLRVLDVLGESARFPLAFAALLHEVGSGGVVGRRIADEIGRDLKLANAERERIGWLIENQRALLEPKTLRESRLKTILAMPGIDELLALHRADAMATTGDVSHVDYCEYYLREQPFGPIDPPPLVTGRDLAQMGLKPGAEIRGMAGDGARGAAGEGRRDQGGRGAMAQNEARAGRHSLRVGKRSATRQISAGCVPLTRPTAMIWIDSHRY